MAFLAVFLYDRYFAYQIAVFDLQGFLIEQKELFMKGLITEQNIKDNLTKLESYLDKLPKNEIVIVAGSAVKTRGLKILPPPPDIKRASANLQNNNSGADILQQLQPNGGSQGGGK
jgi:hypothetical protein